LERYKNFSIRTSAFSGGGVWHGRGIVLDCQTKVTEQLHSVQTVEDFLFLSKQEAEAFALKLCKAWIDSAALSKTM
jgi:hypothetical protein